MDSVKQKFAEQFACTKGAVKKAHKKQAVPEGTACKNIYRETADSVEESAVL